MSEANVQSATVFYKELLRHINDSLTAPARRVQIVPAQDVAIDGACGQLSLTVPAAAAVYHSGTGGCPIGYETTVSISLARCITGMGNNGEPPSAARVTSDGEEYIRDMHEVAAAIQCYKVPERFAGAVEDLKLLAFQALPTNGGVTGGTWTVRVRWFLPWVP